ncbi:hypothetical protein FALBO_2397 [Fusarium albosuccineum]|uniref:Uncharacterized protein n=1 Tax=Fusarium albosuccineum TaxID=1237068 RepID=A0A8H4LMA1_9HYPO|nr:hypothetical protein FALBO_2397 [Fusarium albosuccineum]
MHHLNKSDTCHETSAHDIPDSGSTGPALFSSEISPEEKANAVKFPRETMGLMPTSLVDDLQMGNAADLQDAAGDEEDDRAEAEAKDEISEMSSNVAKLVVGMDSIDLEDPQKIDRVNNEAMSKEQGGWPVFVTGSSRSEQHWKPIPLSLKVWSELQVLMVIGEVFSIGFSEHKGGNEIFYF